MRINNAITTLVGEELEGNQKYWGTLAAPNGFVYWIPSHARRVAKFNPVDKSMTHIGPDFGRNTFSKWSKGAITDSGIIYSLPNVSHRGILKIDTNTNTVTELDALQSSSTTRLLYVDVMGCRSRRMHIHHVPQCSSYNEARY